jgi:hypothetical protein
MTKSKTTNGLLVPAHDGAGHTAGGDGITLRLPSAVLSC